MKVKFIKSIFNLSKNVSHLPDNVYSQQEIFFKSFTSPNQTHFTNLDSTSDHGYIVCGTSSGTAGGDYLIIKIDSNGDEIWRKTNNLFNGLLNDNVPYSVHQNLDGSYLITGKLSTSISNSDAYIINLDSVGNLIWERVFNISSGGFEAAVDGFQLETGEFLILGVRQAPSFDYFLLKLDQNGDSIESKTVSFSPYQARTGISEIRKWNSYYVVNTNVSDTSITFYGNIKQKAPLIFMCDSSLNVVWAQYYLDSIPSEMFGFQITPFNEFNLLISSNSWFTNYERFLKVDTSGSTVYCIMPEPMSSIGCFGLDNNSYSSISTGIDYGCINKHNSLCDSSWLSCHQLLNINAPNRVIYDLRDNSILGIGTIDNGSQTSAIGYVVKIVDTILSSISNVNPESIFIDVIPNPTLSESILKINGLRDNEKRININITNQVGSIVKQFFLGKKRSLTIKKNEFGSGVFLFTIYDDTKVLFSGKFVIN